MDRRTINMIIVAVIIVAAASVFAYEFFGVRNNGGNSGISSNTAPTPSGTVQYSATWSSPPPTATAPNPGNQSAAAAGVAVPTVQVPAAAGSDASLRNFNITAANDAYDPATIIVNQGDTVILNITSVDGDYGFTQPDYGLNATIKKGKTQKVGFQALNAGKFTFYCSSCGGPAKGPVGTLIVTAQ